MELDNNFLELFRFEKNVFMKGYHKSSKTPNLDKTKFIKMYCNLIDSKEDNMFLRNIFIKTISENKSFKKIIIIINEKEY